MEKDLVNASCPTNRRHRNTLPFVGRSELVAVRWTSFFRGSSTPSYLRHSLHHRFPLRFVNQSASNRITRPFSPFPYECVLRKKDDSTVENEVKRFFLSDSEFSTIRILSFSSRGKSCLLSAVYRPSKIPSSSIEKPKVDFACSHESFA